MATGYRTINTALSSSALNASLTGNDIRALEFEGAMKHLPAVALGATGVFSADHLIEASISTLMLEKDVTASPAVVLLGPDTAANASLYQNFFNLRSTSEQRLLRMGLASVPDNLIILANSSTGPQTNDHIILNNVGLTGPAAQQILFDNAAGSGTGCAGNAAGLERLVLVQALNVDPGSEQVEFNILPYSV